MSKELTKEETLNYLNNELEGILPNNKIREIAERLCQNTKPLIDEIYGLSAKIDYLTEENAKLKASKSEANEWISVLLALPNDGIEVSVRLDCAYNGNGIIEPKSSAKFNHSTKYWESGLSSLYSVTHWKPLI